MNNVYLSALILSVVRQVIPNHSIATPMSKRRLDLEFNPLLGADAGVEGVLDLGHFRHQIGGFN